MKILIEGPKDRYEKFMPKADYTANMETVYCDASFTDEERLAIGGDADVFFADASSWVSADLIAQMPNLKLLQSEGVAFDKFPWQKAAELGIYVCNCKGCNADPVAEQAIFLMLGLLRHGIEGDRAVREGRQQPVKEYYMLHGLAELASCHVGLIGLGDIGQATARLLKAFGCQISYYAPRRKEQALEEELGVTYRELSSLLAECDMISIHCPVKDSTRKMVNREFFRQMKPTAYLINTARGAMVDNEALREALITGEIAGAGLDTIDPEPVPADHILLDLPDEAKDKILFSPHLGGNTTESFVRAHRNMWENAYRIKRGDKPIHVVNGV